MTTGGIINTKKAARARAQAHRVLAYRAWATDPSNGAIPPLEILTDPALHDRERARRRRLAEHGIAVAPMPEAPARTSTT